MLKDLILYQSPSLEELRIEVENGFAQSGQDMIPEEWPWLEM